jgi:hypothetical protein
MTNYLDLRCVIGHQHQLQACLPVHRVDAFPRYRVKRFHERVGVSELHQLTDSRASLGSKPEMWDLTMSSIKDTILEKLIRL